MTLLEALNLLRERLPIQNCSPFKKSLNEEFAVYCDLISKIEETEFVALLQVANEGGDANELTKRRFLNFIKLLQHTINQIIERYYNGYPSDAFKLLNNLLYYKKFAPLKENTRPDYITRYVNDDYINYFELKSQEIDNNYFRIRKCPQLWTDKSEYFHVPDKYRGLAKTARFSIPGFPSLYLSNSLHVCWEELDKPKDNIYASRFILQKEITLLNFAIPPTFGIDDIKANPFDVFCFLITYPLLSACLMKVRDPMATFKPEYIIPQLVLQSIRKEEDRRGIIYSSTKCGIDKEYYNIVIPIKGELDNQGFCKKMKETFHLSCPIQLNHNNLYEDEEKLKKMPVQKLN
ncbi:hypothetical protein MASR2M117_06750 [Paludibacter sp.]